MNAYHSRTLGIFFAVALFVGGFQYANLPLQEVFEIPVAHAQADGGDMGGGACDAAREYKRGA